MLLSTADPPWGSRRETARLVAAFMFFRGGRAGPPRHSPLEPQASAERSERPGCRFNEGVGREKNECEYGDTTLYPNRGYRSQA